MAEGQFAKQTDRTSSRANANNAGLGGRSMPAIPVLQQKADDKENEVTQGMQALYGERPAPAAPFTPPPAQRRADMEDEHPAQGKFEVPIQAIRDEEPLQGKFIAPIQKKEPEVTADAIPRFDPIQRKENKTGMPDGLKSGIENLGGYDMSDVKVHYNSDKPAQLQAHAYAQGTDIHIAPGQEQHLPHEAWHVVQQKQGRVQATMQMKGVGINDDSGLEQEADVMGAKAVSTNFQHVSPHISHNIIPQQHKEKDRIRIESKTIQRLEQTNNGIWSDQKLFVTNYDGDNTLLGSSNKDVPVLPGIEWADAGMATHEDSGVELSLHRPTNEEGDNLNVPQDCITTAELVSAWLNKQDIDEIGIVIIPPVVAVADENTDIRPGDILFHMHSDDAGDFHGVAVVGTDGDDVITMEADASENAIGAMNPIFDMYAGHVGFAEDQDEGNVNERTYVFHIAENRGDPTQESLWSSIQDAINDHEYDQAGIDAANFINDTIKNEIDNQMAN